MAQGKVVFDTKTLSRYVEDDLQLLATVKPDLVVGDFRLSLAISAPLTAVPYAAVVNAYWSPFAKITYPVPDLPFTRILGLTLGQRIFNAVRPLAFALHARPLNTLRRRHGLAPIGNDLRKVYTWADHTLYADIPELIPCEGLPANHHYLGPVQWSTNTALPTWWDQLPQEKPIIFASPGSSGQDDLLPTVIQALSGLPATLIAASAGQSDISKLETPENVFVSDYLPIKTAIGNSQLIICNGGSLSTYEALAAGVPVLGLTSNLDQQLNMQAVEHIGAGIALRNRSKSIAQTKQAIETLLNNRRYQSAAQETANVLSHYDSENSFRDIVNKILL